MDLRWGLLLVGLAVLVLVYRYSRSRPKYDDGQTQSVHCKDPLILSVDTPAKPEEVAVADPIFDIECPAAEEPIATELADQTMPEVDFDPDASKIVAIRLMARRHGGFPADKLILALREQGLRHGQFGIFHRPDAENGTRTNFSVANLIEPGSFDLARVKKDYYPGVSIFLMLPGPDDGGSAFDDMLTISRTLADQLDGELVDEQGSSLSIQRERYLREEVVQFQHQLK